MPPVNASGFCAFHAMSSSRMPNTLKSSISRKAVVANVAKMSARMTPMVRWTRQR